MKNVAMPIAQVRAKQTRDIERKRLMTVDVIPAAKKQERVEEISGYIHDVIERANKARYMIELGQDTPENKRIREAEVGKNEDDELWPLKEKLSDAQHVMTKEDKAARLADLDRLDALFNATYGLQPLTKEDQAQRDADKLVHDQRQKESKHAELRRDEYPSIGDQLDALWKTFGKSAILHPETAAMLKAIEGIKAKHPKPDDTNG